jgi:hypothetical protein
MRAWGAAGVLPATTEASAGLNSAKDGGAMSGDLLGGSRLGEAIRLRDAGLALLQREGKESQREEKQSQVLRGAIEFEPAKPEKPYPRLSLLLSSHPLDGHSMLSVWAPRKDKYGKVLNIEWFGDKVEVVSFRRGEWETELLAMGRAAGVAVH